MPVCWSCDRGLAPEATPRPASSEGPEPLNPCPHCAALQPLPAGVDHFRMLGLEPSMGLDRAAVDRAFRQRSKAVHPDRFRTGSSLERKLALEHTTRVNDAYRVLRDRRRRAEYLLHLAGVDLGDEDQRTQDPELLMAMMERTEAIDAAHDVSALEDQARRLQAESDRHLDRAEAHFDRGEGDLAAVARGLEHNRYLLRLAERVDARLEKMT